jgi:hypothetical protein
MILLNFVVQLISSDFIDWKVTVIIEVYSMTVNLLLNLLEVQY